MVTYTAIAVTSAPTTIRQGFDTYASSLPDISPLPLLIGPTG